MLFILEDGPLTFVDANEIAAYARPLVAKMYASGITSGKAGNRYAPKNPYTREHAIVMATRMEFAKIFAASVGEEALKAINDVGNNIPDVPPELYGADAVYKLYNAGVLAGSNAYGDFKPASYITRVEVAAIISRIIDPSMRLEVNLVPKKVPVQGVVFDSDYMGLNIGDSESMEVYILPSNATEQTVTWSSANPAIASVSADGVVTGVSAGKTTITGTVDGVSNNYSVSVAPEPLVFSGNGYDSINDIELKQGAYYIEYECQPNKSFQLTTIWNWNYDSEIITDYLNDSGRGFIAKALKADTTMDLSVKASGDWTIKIYRVNEVGSTNIQGYGNWVGDMFVAPSKQCTIKFNYDEGKSFRVYFARVDQESKTSVWSSDIGDDGTASVYLTEGAYYVPIVITPGNWSIDFGIGDELVQVN